MDKQAKKTYLVILLKEFEKKALTKHGSFTLSLLQSIHQNNPNYQNNMPSIHQIIKGQVQIK